MRDDNCGALVLAAGEGTRMRSTVPKVLNLILGEPMLDYVYRTLKPIFNRNLWTVVGYREEELHKAFPGETGNFITQTERLGTGHALMSAVPALSAAEIDLLFLVNGDTPLLSTQAVESLFLEQKSADADIVFVSITPGSRNDFGRVLRDKQGNVAAIIEAKDYDTQIHGPETGEVNAGLYLFRTTTVFPLLEKIKPDNRKKEYYITDLVSIALEAGLKVTAVNMGDSPELMGINTPEELVRAEEILKKRIVHEHLAAGVLLRSPENAVIGPKVRITPGAQICGPCEIQGQTAIAEDALIDSFTWIKDADISPGAHIRHFSHIENAIIGRNCIVGPYARIRPGSELKENARVGNFVETKKAILAKNAKANHLTYIGDAEVGENVNIGAGTITCNYDGKNKHQTKIGRNSFIGSNTALVAPVEIGEGVIVGAGSTITKDVPDNHLAIARERQKNIPRKK